MTYRTGLPNVLLNTNTVRPLKSINVTAVVTGFPLLLSTTVTSDGDGSFKVPFTIPIPQASKPITWTFTEVSTSTTVVRTDTTPQFDSNIILTNNNSGTLTAGSSSITGSVKVSQGYSAVVEVIAANGSSVGSQSLLNFSATLPQVYNIPIPSGASAGPYRVEARAELHVTQSVAVAANVLEGVTISGVLSTLPAGVSISASGTGPRNQIITVNAFGTNYSVQVDGSKQWQLPLTVPSSPGSYSVTATTSDLVSATVAVTVISIPLTLNSCPVGTSFTGGSGSFVSLSGTLSPLKAVTATFSGVTIAPQVITPNANGTWTLTASALWEPPGSWSVTISAPGETSIVCSGIHAPRLTLPSSITKVQGDPATVANCRGLPSTEYAYSIFGALASTGTAASNSLGVFNIPIPAVPQLLQTFNSATLTVESTSVNISIQPEVPATIDMPSPSALVGGQVILWTNSSFTVSGAMADHGIYNLVANGVPGTLSLGAPGPNSYNATLTTNSTAGKLDLLLDVFRQPSVSKSVIVSPQISFNIPTRILKGSSLIPITITSLPGEQVQLEISGEVAGPIDFVVATIPAGGTYTYNLDTSNLVSPQELTFLIRNKYFAFTPQTRQLTSLSDGELPLNLSLSASPTGTRYLTREVNSVAVGLDSSVNNEVGRSSDTFLSQKLVEWAPPTSLTDFKSYLLEEYTNTSGWQVVQNSAANSFSTAPNRGYRITALYNGYYISEPVYAAGGAGVLAKSANLLSINSSPVSATVATPAGISFFTFINQISYSTTQLASLVDSPVSATVTIPAGLSFFTNLILNNQTDDQLTSLTLSITSPSVTITAGTPFFTV